jgi:hypothetical protein
VAILDLDTNTVIAIEPHREGAKVANWTWQDDRVVVASVDGATDEFILRAARPVAQNNQRYVTDGTGAWSPWGQLDSSQYDRGGGRHRPRTIFQLLFGN